MRIKLDENLPASARSALADAGHDTDTAHAEGLDGADDPDVLAGAAAAGRPLVTLVEGYTAADLAEHVRGTFTWLLEPMLDAAGFTIVDRDIRRGVYAAYTCRRR